MASHQVGIDFGTSTILVASKVGLEPARVLPIGRATPWMPSLIGRAAGRWVVGEEAGSLAERSLVRSVKSNLYSGTPSIQVSGADGSTEVLEVQGAVTRMLSEVARRAEDVGMPLDRVPLRMSCPANWAAPPRGALVAAAGAAGLDASVNRMLDEPISAGVSWVMGRYLRNEPSPDGNVLVFDYGGGTLDVAVLRVTAATPPEITVLASSALFEAGDRLDELIGSEVREDLRDELPQEARNLAAEELDRLFRLAATRLKESLSTSEDVETAISFGAGRPLIVPYTRPSLEAAFAPMMDRALRRVWATLRATELRRRGAASPDAIRTMTEAELARNVSYVLLAGGMSRVPAVAASLARAFPTAQIIRDPSVATPEEAVVAGLVHEEVVSELNLDRPAFDMRAVFVAPSSGAIVGEQSLYDAFTPLYSQDQILRGESQLGRGATVANRSGQRVIARLECVGIDGVVVPLYVNGRNDVTLDADLRPHGQTRFKLYVDGRVVFGHHELRVDRWPVIRGGPNNRIEFRREHVRYEDFQAPGWWGERE